MWQRVGVPLSRVGVALLLVAVMRQRVGVEWVLRSANWLLVVYRAWHPVGDSLAAHRALIAQRLVRPNKMELWLMNADGSDQHQITHLGGANFDPSWTPNGRRLIFSSNYKQPRSGNFDLFLVNLDGTGLEQVTTHLLETHSASSGVRR